MRTNKYITHTAQISESNEDIMVGDLVKADGTWSAQTTCPLYRIESISPAMYHDERGWGFRIVGLSEFTKSPAFPSSRDLPAIARPETAANLPLVKNLAAA